MTKAKLALGGLLGVAMAVAWSVQQAALDAERAEQARLLAQKTATAAAGESRPDSPPADAEQAARERAELERLRAESGNLRAQIDEAKATVQARAAAKPKPSSTLAAADNVIRSAEARDVGQATPAAMVQTVIWAVTHGDTNRMYELMAFDPGADLERVQRDMKGLREQVDKTGSDGMLTSGPPELRILADQVTENNDHWLSTVETRSDGSTGKTERVRIRLTDTGWRLVIGTNGEPVHETVDSPP